jgi:MurNAc alpha-1-phosphate uridylyltransferase
MVLAAGFGTRMRPLTNDRPKALVEVDGKALIDHMLDRLEESGVRRVVVNLHAFADLLRAHLERRKGKLDIALSPEPEGPYETGGGVKFACALLGDDPILVANIDSVWTGRETRQARRLIETFDPSRMGTLLMTTPTKRALGFDGPGDAFMDETGRLVMRRQRPGADTAPLAYMGLHATDPRAIYAHEGLNFSLAALWMRQADAGRLFGMVLEGDWMHVGDPASRALAERVVRGELSFDQALAAERNGR